MSDSLTLMLTDLPSEMQIAIFEELDSPSLRALRLVSKSLAANANDLFAKQHFETRTHFVSLQGLQALIDITAHPFFGKKIQLITLVGFELGLNMNSLNWANTQTVASNNYKAISRAEKQARSTLIARWSQYEADLFRNNRAPQMLEQAFENLAASNVRPGVAFGDIAEEYYRPHVNASSVYGYTDALQLFGPPVSRRDFHARSTSHVGNAQCAIAVLNAMVHANASRGFSPSSLQLLYLSSQKTHLLVGRLPLSPTHDWKRFKSLVNVFSDLTTLTVDPNCSSSMAMLEDLNDRHISATELKELRLQHVESRPNWLLSFDGFHRLSKSLSRSPLEKMVLTNCFINSEARLAALQKFMAAHQATLRSFSISKVDLGSDKRWRAWFAWTATNTQLSNFDTGDLYTGFTPLHAPTSAYAGSVEDISVYENVSFKGEKEVKGGLLGLAQGKRPIA